MKDWATSLGQLCDLGVSAVTWLRSSHLSMGVRTQIRRTLFLVAMILGLVVAGPGHDLTTNGKDHKTGAATTDEELAIRQLDADGMRTLVGRSGDRRRPLALYLFYTACRPCTDRLGDIERLNDEYRDKGLDVALVSIAPMDDRRKLLNVLGPISRHVPTFLLDNLDDDFAEEFFLHDWEPVVPSVFFYSPRGKLEYSETDAASITLQSLRGQAEVLLRALRKN